jgi:LmbE family N-acetylglucosaminyl deacetylase
MNLYRKVLYISAHCDDIEFSCGGTLSKMVDSGIDVSVLNFSFCANSLPPGVKASDIKSEFFQSMNNFGINKKDIFTYDYPVRELPNNRQDILEIMVKYKNKMNPSLVFVPNSNDVHQDHNVVFNEAVRAFRGSSIFGYELPWNCLSFNSNCHIKLSKKNVEKKYSSIDIYKSQKFRGKSDRELVFSQARVRGCQIDTEYAEAFEVIRLAL